MGRGGNDHEDHGSEERRPAHQDTCRAARVGLTTLGSGTHTLTVKGTVGL